MTEDLLAYLLDDLCPERRALVERRLAIDPKWQKELERLQECLAAGGDPCTCSDEPPRDLVKKTCTLVKHVSDSGCGTRPALPLRAFTPATAGACAAARHWTMTDVAVGVGILMVLGALVTPALYETRATSRRLACQNNLKELGVALFAYQEQRHNKLPAVRPGDNAGIYAVELMERGGMTREQLQELLLCPESQLAEEQRTGRFVLYLPSRDELQAAEGEQLAELLRSMGGSFAYRVGYFDKQGQYRQMLFTGKGERPLLGDAPELSAQGVRSANHGCGQNVLYECLNVKFRTNCVETPTNDNIFLNAAGAHAAGLGEDDLVLIRSEYGPRGPLVPVGE